MKIARQFTSVGMLVAAMAAVAAPAVPSVDAVTMTQPGPTRHVTITYSLADAPAVITLDVQTNANTSAAADDPGWTSIGGEAVWNATGDVWKKVGDGLTEGDSTTGTITWRPDLSWPDHMIADGGARAVVTAWALDNTPDYMVVDVSDAAQPNTQRYYPGADFVPGGVSNGHYKTTTLLMRKIMAKGVTWTMGSTALETQIRQAAREATHQVTLTNNYYIGVYEVTQSQWSQIATNSTVSAKFKVERFMRPMENLCYNELRLKAASNAAATSSEIANYGWPKKPNPSSFLGLLRLKTGLDFDLPSEAQWEFAARAGNGVGHWNDGSAMLNTNPDANLDLLCRYRNTGGYLSATVEAPVSCGVTNGTAAVGSYLPNSWGLYDMHGNVWEWCLDWYQANIATAKDASGEYYNGRVNIDPSNSANYLSGESASSAKRVSRGGGYISAAGYCRPAQRSDVTPVTRDRIYGLRVVCTAGLK